MFPSAGKDEKQEDGVLSEPPDFAEMQTEYRMLLLLRELYEYDKELNENNPVDRYTRGLHELPLLNAMHVSFPQESARKKYILPLIDLGFVEELASNDSTPTHPHYITFLGKMYWEKFGIERMTQFTTACEVFSGEGFHGI